MNRSVIFHFLNDESPLLKRYAKVGMGNFPVFKVPEEWYQSYLLVNDIVCTDFQAVMLFSSELVVRFDRHSDCQVNIPYSSIKYLEVREYMNEEQKALHEK